MDSDTYFRMATIRRSIESWLAGLTDVHINLWTSVSEPTTDGPHDPFFAIGLDGNPVTGAGSVPAFASFNLACGLRTWHASANDIRRASATVNGGLGMAIITSGMEPPGCAFNQRLGSLCQTLCSP
jgi:hypothetical protein